ncbi:hypothetical protein GUJ93_ZPchr0006g41109 [Zizania palustris]|uniref:Uncharacterized protein n=1 Tax=Zizania palustris TaxID=103762 RepID=A0A8J5W509_ZIZPA|nr:hypothetical protein GUJ93_ZPchr0006g41109 [Zizania palustris]
MNWSLSRSMGTSSLTSSSDRTGDWITGTLESEISNNTPMAGSGEAATGRREGGHLEDAEAASGRWAEGAEVATGKRAGREAVKGRRAEGESRGGGEGEAGGGREAGRQAEGESGELENLGVGRDGEK